MTAEAWITGEAPNQKINFRLPSGNKGPQGIQGLKGDKGDKGLDGSNVLPTNDAVAQAIETEGPTKSALSAAIVERTAALIGERELDSLFAKLDLRDPGMLVIAQASDSTGDSPWEWFETSWRESLAAIWPERPARAYRWDKGTDKYLPPVTIQTGAGGLTNVSVGLDTFSTDSPNLAGRVPEIGAGSWGVPSGTWAVTGGYLSQSEMLSGVAGFATQQRDSVDGVHTLVAEMTTTGAVQVLDFFPVSEGIGYGNRLYVRCNGTNAQTIVLNLVSGGVATTLATIASGQAITLTETPSTHTFTITISGLNVTLDVDGISTSATLTQSQKDSLTGAYAFVGINKGPSTKILSVEVQGTRNVVPPYGQVTVYNAGYAGGRASHQLERLDSMFPVKPDVLFINHGHNYSTIDSTPTQFLAALDTFVDAFHVKWPGTPIVCLSQNPKKLAETVDASKVTAHVVRQVALRGHCAVRGWGYIPGMEAFAARTDGGDSLVNADGVHVAQATSDIDNLTGARLQAETAKAWIADKSIRP